MELRQAEDDVVLVAHPKPVKWNSIMGVIADSLNVKLVPYNDWFGLLEKNYVVQNAPAGDDPALKLLDVFRGLLTVSESTGNRDPSESIEGSVGPDSVELRSAMRSSVSLGDSKLPQLTANDARIWLLHWRNIQFL